MNRQKVVPSPLRAFAVAIAAVILIAVPGLADVDTLPLYQYKSDQLNFLYTTSAKLPAGLSGEWKNEGVVCHVPKPSAQTRPIYSLVKADNLGVRYAYTSSATETAAGWQRQEAPAFHVAAQKLPGSTAFYRLYAPLRIDGDPDGFSAPAPGSDTHFYTTDVLRRSEAISAGWLSQGVIGYVWLEPQRAKPRIVIQKQAAGAPPKPSIKLVGAKLHPQVGSAGTSYSVDVMNAAAYPSEWFVSGGKALPPNPCGKARLLASVYVIRGGKRQEASCVSLLSPASLATLQFSVDKPLGDSDAVQVVIEDRLLKTHMVSEQYKAGWLDVGPLLASAGCKPFLGRAGSYLCTGSKAFATCESIRKSGKPIACTQAGKKSEGGHQ